VAIQQTARNVVVPVAEHCSGNRDLVAYDTLCRVTAAVDLRKHFFDDDALAAFGRFHCIQC
jgi:hypothetical protein